VLACTGVVYGNFHILTSVDVLMDICVIIRQMSRFQNRDRCQPRDTRDHQRTRDYTRDQRTTRDPSDRHNGRDRDRSRGYATGQNKDHQSRTRGYPADYNKPRNQRPEFKEREWNGPIRHSSIHRDRPRPYISNAKIPMKIEDEADFKEREWKGPTRHSSIHRDRPRPYISNTKLPMMKIEDEGLALLDRLDALEDDDSTAKPAVSILDILNNLSTIDFESLSTTTPKIESDGMPILDQIASLETAVESDNETSVAPAKNVAGTPDDIVSPVVHGNSNECKGCNPPDNFSPSISPFYYDERCTCTYCPACSPIPEVGEYDPVFPFYQGSNKCKCPK
jgi:hypothetical protein